jgi:hypothetical protein
VAGSKLNYMKAKLIILFFIPLIGFSQGFYKREKDPQGKYLSDTISDTCHYSLAYAMNGVYGGKCELLKEKYKSYSYPVCGWWWADSDEKAMAILKIRIDEKRNQ